MLIRDFDDDDDGEERIFTKRINYKPYFLCVLFSVFSAVLFCYQCGIFFAIRSTLVYDEKCSIFLSCYAAYSCKLQHNPREQNIKRR